MIKRGWLIRDKSGQFYLVSAIIVAAIVMSIVVVTNYSKKQEYSDLDSLKDEIQIEAANVLDYSINNSETDSAINSRMQDFAQDYISLESRDKDLYFIFGSRDNITVKGYQKTNHIIYLDTTLITSSSEEFIGSINPGGNSINFKIDNDSHTFALNDGQNFYLVLSRDIEGGNYVVTG